MWTPVTIGTFRLAPLSLAQYPLDAVAHGSSARISCLFLLGVYHWFSRQEDHHSDKQISLGRQGLTQPTISSPVLRKVPEIARHACCPTQQGGQEETNGQKDDAHMQGLDPLPVKSDQGMLMVSDCELARGLRLSR